MRLEVRKASLARKRSGAVCCTDVGMQPHQPLVAGHGREHVGVQDRAHVIGHVVVHPVGMNRAIALAEDDVPFHVELQRRALVLQRRAIQVGRFRAAVIQITSRSVKMSIVP